MNFKRLTFRTMTYAVLIGLQCILISYLILQSSHWFLIVIAALAELLTIAKLYRFLQSLTKDIDRFNSAMALNDYNASFSKTVLSTALPNLYHSFSQISRNQRSLKIETESMFQLLKIILEQIPVGIIVLETGSDFDRSQIVLFNNKAESLLKVPSYKYWQRFEKHRPEFAQEVRTILQGGKKYIETRIQDAPVQLSTEVLPIRLNDQQYTIISLQNIRDQIEQQETEVWNRLIGVISHELLNSITPISSLSATVSNLVYSKDSFSEKEILNLRAALSAITRRSKGLLDFVKDYRLMAELPTPAFKEHYISEILNDVRLLMQPLATASGIQFDIAPAVPKLILTIDLKLIQQALINLITNSIYALEHITGGMITIDCRLEDDQLLLDVIDNGKGMDEETQRKAFLPFFTTRTNGSGIGLVITRNIMKLHKGNIEVSSIPYEQTVFSLVFKL